MQAALARSDPGLSSTVVCPGFIDTGMTPAINQIALPVLSRAAVCLGGLQYLAERERTHSERSYIPDRLNRRGCGATWKYVLRAGVLELAGSVVSCGSQWAVEDQDRMLRL